MNLNFNLVSCLKVEKSIKAEKKTTFKTKSKINNNKPVPLAQESEAKALIFVLGSAEENVRLKELNQILKEHVVASQHKLASQDKRILELVGHSGMIYVLQNVAAPTSVHQKSKSAQHGGLFVESAYAQFRDLAGPLWNSLKSHKISKVHICFDYTSPEMVRGLAVGLELASYHFLNIYNQKKLDQLTTYLEFKQKAQTLEKEFLTGLKEAQAIQLARHFVNLPPNEVNPTSIEKWVTQKNKWPKTIRVDVWNEKKLESENMGLLLAVGSGSRTPPRMIHLSYRPAKKSKKKPIAFIGKGITFDTGGLDIKPSAGMRLMKKDMGGAAAVLGLAHWVSIAEIDQPCDFYLALAENSVDAHSMRPSDLYKSRAGYVVEIDNTDAEGRLVLADVMDVAATQKGADEPAILVDVATLTGAIKVALGADVAGLFSNDDLLSNQLVMAGHSAGELCWRMPLVPKYFGSLTSNFADFKNSADGFGGAITAALFLERFSKGKKWAHLDVYCWTDKAQGPYLSAGASGQPVQLLIEWLKSV